MRAARTSRGGHRCLLAHPWRLPSFAARVPVQTLFDYLENGEPLDEFLTGFPTVSRELAIQVLEESKELRLARVC